MKEILIVLQVSIASMGGFFGWFFGPSGGLLTALVVFVIADYFSGVLKAIVEKKLSSEVGSKGIVKKMVIFIMVGIAHMLDVEILGQGDILRNVVIFFYISNEGISILENSIALGLPVPKKLNDLLLQIRNKTEEETEDGNK